MHRLVLGLSERNSISAGGAKLMVSVCLLLCVSSAAVTSRGSNAARGSDTAFGLQAARAEAKPEIQELKQGNAVERELAGGAAHTYRTMLTSGQYFKVMVEQRGIDVTINVFGPNDQKFTGVDNHDGAQDSETASVVAEVPGNYRVEVLSANDGARPGRYEVRIEGPREPSSQDRALASAERIFHEGKRFYSEGTAESLRKTIEKFETSLSQWRALGNRRSEATALHEIGIVYLELSDYKKAREYLNQALLLWRAVENKKQEGGVLSNLAWVHMRLGETREALKTFLLALPLIKTARNSGDEAAILGNIATAYMNLSEPQRALEYFNQALPIVRVAGDRQVEAIILAGIGTSYKSLGELQTSLEYYRQALPLIQAKGDRLSEASALNNIAGIYSALGELQRALDLHNQSLALRRIVGDRRGESFNLENMGVIYVRLGELQKALELHNQALRLRRAVGDRRGEAYTLQNIGGIYDRLGEPQKALDLHNQALLLMQATGDRQGQADVLYKMGLAYSHLDDPKKAVEYQSQALQISREIGNRLVEAAVLYGIARTQSRLGDTEEALKQIVAAIDILETTRSRVSSQELRNSFRSSKQDFYEFYIDLLMQMHKAQPSAGHETAALQSSERSRARSLVDILTEARADIRQGLDAVLLERERSLQQQLNVKSERLTRLLSGKHTEEQAAAARKEVEVLLGEYHDVESQIRTTSPRYAALTQPQPLSLKEIQHLVLDEDTLLLEYALGEERSYLWAVTPTLIKSYELPKRAEIEAAGRRVYDLLVAKADALYPEALTTLSQMLLKPVADQLGRKRLVIVAEGALQYIPFGALPAPETGRQVDTGTRVSDRRVAGSPDPSVSSTPLIVNHEIVSLPSASVLAILRRELGTRKPAARTVAVLADPVFDKDDQRVKSKIKSQQRVGQGEGQKETLNASLPSDVERSIKESGLNSFDRLVLSRREAESITSLASNGQPFKALDFIASRATATRPELDQYQIVHFATHSLLNNQHPELSGIVLSLVDDQGQPQDGFLRLHEIYNLKLNAELVVLSACQTALGRDIKGEGLVGLTRGFMYAGAPRVVASLWKVSDKATAELMKRFYQKMLKETMRPAAALRAAQVSMLKEKQWEAAYYWAGFVLQGEWR